MARISATLVVRLPWWYRARIATIAALACAGFAIDMEEQARDIVEHSRFTMREG